MIGVPMDLGAGRRGVDMGPSALRIGGLQQKLEALKIPVEDYGNVEVKIPEEAVRGEKRQMFLHEIAQVCKRVAVRVIETLEEKKFPLVLGGDHSLAAGSIAGTSSFYGRQNEKIGLIWLDAHTDMNTRPRAALPGTSMGCL